MTTNAVPARARWTDTLLVGAAALALFALLRQEVFYHIDARLHILFAERGDLLRSRHLAYIPLLYGLHELLAPRVEWFAIASWLSVAGMALGVALLHRASVALGISRAAGFAVAALLATNPAVMFYASVAELHGPFLPAAGLAAICLARLVHRPGAARMLALGAAIGLSYLLHATGLSLLVMLPLLYVALAHRDAAPRRRLGELARCIALAALPAFGFAFGVPLLLRALGAIVDEQHAAKVLLGDPATLWSRLVTTPVVLWREWIVACLPLSIAWLPALRGVALRPLAAALMLTIAAFAVMTAVLLGTKLDERGAYFLPVLWPAALLAALSVRAPWALVLAMLGALLGARQIAAHEQPAPARAFAAAVQAASGGQPPTLIIGGSDELDHCLTHLPGTRYVFVPALPAIDVDGMVEFVRNEIRQGRAVVLTAGARAALQAGSGSAALGPELLRRLEHEFALRESAAGAVRVARLNPH